MANTLRCLNDNFPTKEELSNFRKNFAWENLELEKINNWTQNTDVLVNEINKLYSNGEIKINKYKIIGDNKFLYYLVIDNSFIQNICKNKKLLEDRNYLNLNGESPTINIIKHWTDIYTLSGDLARILGYGGAYTHGIGQNESWKIATEFIEKEFGNRFEEFDYYDIKIENSKWFYDIAWDYSFIIIDKRNYEIIFIDITDTD